MTKVSSATLEEAAAAVTKIFLPPTVCVPTYRIVLQGGDVGLHGTLHVPGRNQGRRQVDVPVDEVRL